MIILASCYWCLENWKLDSCASDHTKGGLSARRCLFIDNHKTLAGFRKLLLMPSFRKSSACTWPNKLLRNGYSLAWENNWLPLHQWASEELVKASPFLRQWLNGFTIVRQAASSSNNFWLSLIKKVQNAQSRADIQGVFTEQFTYS